jgi:hypothetical protein
MPLVDLGGTKGFIGMYPVEPNSLEPIEGLQIPDGMAYLLVDIDTGKGTLNITPNDALKMIEKENRFPLTIDEGVALVTHHPQILRNGNCFSLFGSRRGDRRVTALWISKGKTEARLVLGWQPAHVVRSPRGAYSERTRRHGRCGHRSDGYELLGWISVAVRFAVNEVPS